MSIEINFDFSISFINKSHNLSRKDEYIICIRLIYTLTINPYIHLKILYHDSLPGAYTIGSGASVGGATKKSINSSVQ